MHAMCSIRHAGDFLGCYFLNIIDYSTLLLLAVTKTRFSILIFELGYVISIGHVWGGEGGGVVVVCVLQFPEF